MDEESSVADFNGCLVRVYFERFTFKSICAKHFFFFLNSRAPKTFCEILERLITWAGQPSERSGRVSSWRRGPVTVSADAPCLTSLFQSVAVSSDTSPPPPPPPPALQQESKLIRVCVYGGVVLSGTPCTACKSLPYSYMRILCRPAWPLPRIVISHQADQRTATGSERTLTRRSPCGWQAIAHPLTGRHTLHLTAVSARHWCLKHGAKGSFWCIQTTIMTFHVWLCYLFKSLFFLYNWWALFLLFWDFSWFFFSVFWNIAGLSVKLQLK